MDETEASAIPWHELVAILRRRKTLIVSVFICGVITSVVLSFLQDPTYRASAKLMVTSKRAHITVSPDPSEGPTVDRVTDQDLYSEIALLQSPALVREVLEPLQDEIAQQPKPKGGWLHDIAAIVRYPLQLPTIIYQNIHRVAPPSDLDQWVESTIAHLSVADIRGSNLILVSYEGLQPVWAAEVVNKLVTRHVERHVRLDQQAEALGFLESQRQLLSERVRKAEEALTSFYQREGVESAPEQRAGLRTRLAELRAALANADTEFAEGSARADFLARAIEANPKNLSPDRKFLQNDPLQLLRSRILELELQRSETLSKFAPTSIKVQEVDRQIEEARQLLARQEKTGGDVGVGATNPAHQKLELDLTQTQAQMAALRARSEALRAHIADDEARLQHLDQVAAEQDRLDQELASAKESLKTYSKKQEEARFSDALDASRIVNVSIVEPAQIPTAPLPSKRQMVMLMGSVMSLFASLALAFARDKLDPTVKSAAEAQRVSGFRVLADIPS